MSKRRRKSDGEAALIILGLFGLLLFYTMIALAVVSPVILAIIWAYCEWGSRKTEQAIHDLPKISKSLKALEKHFSEISLEGSDLYIKRNGRFDERSRRGRQLNDAIDAANNEFSLLLKRRQDLITPFANRISARKAVITYLASSIALVTVKPDWLQSFSADKDVSLYISSLFCASVAAMIVGGIAKKHAYNKILNQYA